MTANEGWSQAPQAQASPLEPTAGRTLPPGRLAGLWHSEVPKVILRHEEERLQVRKALGLAI